MVTVLLSYLIRYGVCLHIGAVFGRMWSERHGRLPAGLTAFDQHLAGLDGIDHRLPAPDVYRGDAYSDPTLTGMTTTMHESIQEFRHSSLARKAFGDEVHGHLAAFFATELARFEHTTVTDWEVSRYFGRI